jgi:voltage-gated potassium channel
VTATTAPPDRAAARLAIHRRAAALARPGLFRFSVARFLAALVLLFVASPFVEAMRNGPVVETVLATVVLCMGVLAVGGRRRTLVLAVVFALPAIVGSWVHHIWQEGFPTEAVLATRLVFLAFVIARLLVFILCAAKVNSEVLCAGVSVYLLIGLVWSLGYRLVASAAPDAFAFSVPPSSSHEMTRFNALYFSFMTLTTVGYGDITPVSPVARMLAIMEAMSGTLFVGMLIARLVSLYSVPGPPELANGPGTGPAPTPPPAGNSSSPPK